MEENELKRHKRKKRGTSGKSASYGSAYRSRMGGNPFSRTIWVSLTDEGKEEDDLIQLISQTAKNTIIM